MNIELLLKVKEAILAEPTKFDMAHYVQHSDVSPCGTAACIAGFAVAIDRGYKKLSRLAALPFVESVAIEVLSITGHQADRLFYTGGWPSEFRDPYYAARDSEDHAAMARVAVARIDCFVATNGAE